MELDEARRQQRSRTKLEDNNGVGLKAGRSQQSWTKLEDAREFGTKLEEANEAGAKLENANEFGLSQKKPTNSDETKRCRNEARGQRSLSEARKVNGDWNKARES